MRALVLVLLLVAFGLRLFNLGLSDFWGDEAASYCFSRQSLLDLFTDIARDEPHPPFYYSLLHFWIALLGKGNFVLRFPSALAGVALVAAIYGLGRRLGGPRLGVAAALLATLHPWQVWYSQETRMYVFGAAFGVLSTLLYLRLFDRRSDAAGDTAIAPSLAALAGYVVVAWLGMLSHYYVLFVVLFQNVHFLLMARRWRNVGLRRWLVLQATLALLFLPWPLFAWRVFFVYRKVVAGQVAFAEVLRAFAATATAGWTLDADAALLVAAALLPLLGQGLWWLRGHRALALPLLYCGVPLAAAALFSIARPAFEARYLFIVSPALLLLWAAGLAAAWGPLAESSLRPRAAWRRLPIAALSLGALGWAWGSSLTNLYFNPAYIKGGYSTLTDAIEAEATPGDAVILNGVSQVYLYDTYKRRELPLYFLPPVERPDGYTSAAMVADLQRIAADHSGLWLLMSATAEYDPEGAVKAWLDANAYAVRCGVTVDSGFCYYRTPPAAVGSPTPVGARFGTAITLDEFVTPPTVESGDALPLALAWRATQPIAANYKVFAHLRDERGVVWAQNDSPPANGLRHTFTWQPGETIVDRRGLRLPPGTPPGRYSLVVGVYDAASGARLAVAGASEVRLTTVEVTPLAESRLAAMTPPVPTAVFGGRLGLIDSEASPRLRAGEPATIRLTWAAMERAPDAAQVIARLVSGVTVAEARLEPAALGGGAYPPSRWRAGEVVAGAPMLTPPPTLAAGGYSLQIAALDSAGQSLPLTDPSPAGRTTWFELAPRIEVSSRARSYARPSPQHARDVELGGVARLLGYDLEFEDSTGRAAAPRAGDTIVVRLHWEALTATAAPYNVFVHLVELSSGALRAQHDGPPVLPIGKDAPTTSWLAGEFIADDHTLALPPDAAPGDYELRVGLYEPVGGARLSAEGGLDYVALGRLRLGG